VGRDSLLHHLAVVSPPERQLRRAASNAGIARNTGPVGDYHCPGSHSGEPTLRQEIIAATRKLIHEGPSAPPAWIASFPLIDGRLVAYWNLLRESSASRFSEIVKWLPTVKDAVLGSGRALGAGVFQIVLSLLMVFLFYRNGETAADRLTTTISRLGGGEGRHLLEIAGTTMSAVAYGVFGCALVQGVLAGAGFMIAGVPGAALLGFFTFVVAVIPGGSAAGGSARRYLAISRGINWRGRLYCGLDGNRRQPR
jgi:predicted PurR-regulated permease PerM